MDKHVVNGILLNQKNILPFVTTWMDLEGIMLTEISQTERQILYNLTYMWNLKNKTNKTKWNCFHFVTHRYREQTGGCQRGRW